MKHHKSHHQRTPTSSGSLASPPALRLDALRFNGFSSSDEPDPDPEPDLAPPPPEPASDPASESESEMNSLLLKPAPDPALVSLVGDATEDFSFFFFFGDADFESDSEPLL
jgi:hypothetical protein